MSGGPEGGPPEALIFDVDGTLAETEEAHRRAFNDAFAEAGLPWRWDRPLYARLLDVNGGKERIRHYVEAFGPGPRLDDASVRRLHERKTEVYEGLVASGEVALRPGVARLLAEARAAGVRLAVATTTSRTNVETLIAAALGRGALGWFEAVAAGDEAAAKKPAPDVYRLALDRLRLPPERCVAFEDPRHGLASALGAGVPTVVTVSAYTAADAADGAFRGALTVLDGLGEPDLPCRALDPAGLSPPGPCVDLGALRFWFRRQEAAGSA